MTNWTLSSPYHHGTIDIDDYNGTLGLSTTESIMLHITDVNETPSMIITGIDFENPTVAEDADTNNPIAVITTYDDDGDTVTLSVDNTTDFNVVENAFSPGMFELYANSLDHETNDPMDVNITASDGNTSTTKQLSLNVTDVNERLSLLARQ